MTLTTTSNSISQQPVTRTTSTMTPQNSRYSVWLAALDQWDVFKNATEEEKKDIRSVVVFRSGYSALYITCNDEVYGVGMNGDNVNILGLGAPQYREQFVDRPVLVRCLSNKDITVISMGVYIGSALDREGWLYWWGCTSYNYGQIMTPQVASRAANYVSLSTGAMFMAAVSTEGWVHVWGRLWNTSKFYHEQPLLTDGIVVSLSCGLNHMGVVTKDGQPYTWGDGQYGQRGTDYVHPTHDDSVRRLKLGEGCSAVTCGGHSTLFLGVSGKVWACGANSKNYGYLGVSSTEELVAEPSRVLLPEEVVEMVATWENTLLSTFAALTNRGNVFVWGRSNVPVRLNSIGTSLVGPFIGDPTPRDLMVFVRPPILVPPVQNSVVTSSDGQSSQVEQVKKNKYSVNSSISAIVAQLKFA